MEGRWYLVAQTDSVLSDTKENSGKERHKRYNSSEKGKRRTKRYQASLKNYLTKVAYKRKIKEARVIELEKELLKYEQKDSN